MPIDDTLKDRGKTHGPWPNYCHIAQELKGLVMETNTPKRTEQINEGLDMICGKLARILTGDPNEPDHWRDIQGYARLVEKEILINTKSFTIAKTTTHHPDCNFVRNQEYKCDCGA
jgi:hypothetical protein